MNVFEKASKNLQRIGSTPRKYLVEFELKRLTGLMEYLAIKRESAPVGVTVSKAGKAVSSRPSNNGVWNEKLSMQVTLFEKTVGAEHILESKKVLIEVHLLKAGSKGVVIGSCEVDVASIASISGEPNSRQLELLLKGSSSNSLRGTELKLSLQVTTSGLNTDNDSTSSPRSLGRRSSQSYSNAPSEASSPLSSNTPLESRSPSLIGERSLPALPRVPTSDERRFSLFSKTVNSKTSPNELSKYPSNSSSTQSMNNESDSATGQEATETTKSPQTKRSSRANSLFGSLKNKVEAHGRRQTPQGEDDKMNISMSPKSPQDSPSPGLQRSFSQLSYSGESKMDDIDTLREQLGKEREHIKSLEEELKRRDEQMRLNKASYQEELQQLTSLLFQERNKLSVVEEQRKKLQQELSSMREKNSSPKETQADSSSSVSTLYEENERLKRENRELRDKLNSLPEYPWTNGSPVNVQVAPLLENNQKYGKHDGPFTVGQLVQELVSMKVKYAESQSELEKERQRIRSISKKLETAKRQNSSMAMEMTHLQRELSSQRQDTGGVKNNNSSPSLSKRVAADRSLDMENSSQNEDISLRRSLKKKAKGWKKVFH